MAPHVASHACLALLAAASILFVGPAAAIDPREPAPKFSGKTLDGERFANETLKGKVVLLQFWTTWCPHCRSDQPALDLIVEAFRDKGLVVLAVDIGESKKKVKRYLEQSPRACRIVLNEDTNLPAVFAANSYPLYVLIDRNGKIAGTQSGAAGLIALLRLLRNADLHAEDAP